MTLAAGAAADVAVSEAAKRHFRAGVALLRDPSGPRYEQAYRAFAAAYRESPSPKILGNLGMCAMMLERDGEAIEAYKKYLSQAGARDEAERQQITRDLLILQSNVVWVELRVAPGDAVLLDERFPVQGATVQNRYQSHDGKLAAGIRAGQHRFTLSREGHKPITWLVEARPGQPVQKAVTLERVWVAPGPGPAKAAPPTGTVQPAPAAADEGGSLPVSVWVMGSATLALGAGAAVVGGLALSNHADFESTLDAGDKPRARELREQGQTLNIVTDVLLGATAAAAATTVVLLVTGSSDEPAAGWQPAAVAGPGGGFVGLRGRF